jgi:hypothetical protein
MNIKLLSPLWGHEHLPLQTFLDKIRAAGYDGIDTWLPDNASDRRTLFDYLQRHELYMVAHQHSAAGSTFKKFRTAFIRNLRQCAASSPLLINSHTGKDYFSLEQNIELIDAAQEFSEKTGIAVVHETHRGRLGYSPQMTGALFEKRKNFHITADFSHWTCVTESMLENFTSVVSTAIKRTRCIHARVGFEQGPQVADPRAPEWKYAVDKFLGWWDKIIATNNRLKNKIFPVTTEFGPPPYMPVTPFSHQPVSDQFEINCYMKDLLRERYSRYC